MASRFDRRDPGQDPAYCDGLAASDDGAWDAEHSDVLDAQLFCEPDSPTCYWCGQPMADDSSPYCDAICAIQAEKDSREDRDR